MEKLIEFLKSFLSKKNEIKRFGLGAIPNEPDNRDIKYTDIVGVVKITDKKITVPGFLETERLLQGQLGTCVEHAFEFIRRVEDGIVHSRRVPYVETRNFLGWTEQNGEGLPQREAAKVACVFGMPKDTGIDNNSLPHKLYTALDITKAMREDANIYRMGGFSFVPIDVNSIKQSLVNGKLVAITIAIDWDEIDRDGNVHIPKSIFGYHEIVIGQSNDNTGKFRCANWWGYDLYISYDELTGIVNDSMNFLQIPEDLILRAKQTPFLFTQDLSYGMNLDAVLQLQKRLSGVSLYNAGFDRKFGPKLLQAVKDYQKIKGLTVDGKVGPLTRALLNS